MQIARSSPAAGHLATTIVYVLCALCVTAQALPSLNLKEKQTYCGQAITQTLSMFCKNRFISMMDIVLKRGLLNDENDHDDEETNGAGAGASSAINGNNYAYETSVDAGRQLTGTDPVDDMLADLIAQERFRLEHNFGAVSLLQRLRGTGTRHRGGMGAAAAAGSAERGGGGSGAVTTISRHRRASQRMYVVRGIADECCLKPCSVETLLSYCRTPPKY